MGWATLSPAVVLDQVHRPFDPSTMLGSAVNRTATSSDSAYRQSPTRSALQQHDHPPGSTGSARSPPTATNNTPISSSPPPSTSSVASSTAPQYPSPHDVPAYVRAQSHQHSSHRTPSLHSSVGSAAMNVPQQTPPSAPPFSHDARGDASLRQTTDPQYYPQTESYASAQGITAAYPGQQRMSSIQSGLTRSPSSPRLHPTYPSTQSLGGSEATSPSRIKVRDLSHIQSFASEEFLEQSQRARRPGRGPQEVGRQYEISSMPVTDIIEMVAGLLTKITATNDMQHEHIHRHIPPPDGAANLSPQASSVLAFHGKNVPSITILSYLTRIHKYCPTTYEVFLSLLVYFDRMTEMVNNQSIQRRRRRMDSVSAQSYESRSRSTSSAAYNGPAPTSYPSVVTPPSSTVMTAQDPQSPESAIPASLHLDEDDEDNFFNFFVVDSFNIHRLVIAGVTCASKFFSDVFYTNSRYAKVGGLPLVELNHLELQFLLLNDFRLFVPVEELEAYGTMLVEFYAREVVAQQQHQAALAMAADQSSGRRRERSAYNQTPTPPQS